MDAGDASTTPATIDDIVAAARHRLQGPLWGHIAGGSGTEMALARNHVAWEELALRPRVLRDVSARSTATTFLGRDLSLPIMLAPIGGIARVHPDGAVAVARAAGEVGTAAFVSINSSHTLEEVRRGAPDAVLVFQIYAFRDDELRTSVLRLAEAAGCIAVCVTVDTNVYGRRERDIRSGFRGRDGTARNYGGRAWPDGERAAASWEDFARIRERTPLPLILKGIMTGEDADLAVRHGADVVYVSNHGGRQLDDTLGTADALVEVVNAVGGRVPILVDGAITHGSDVLKALALGAQAALIGRLEAYGLAARGEAGLVQALRILQEELDVGLGLLGCVGPHEVSPGHVTRLPGRPREPTPVSPRP